MKSIRIGVLGGGPFANSYIQLLKAHPLVEEVRLAEYSHAPRVEMYTNGTQPYDRAPHMFIGFPARFFSQRKYPNRPDEVELQDTDGRPLPGFSLADSAEITGDQIEHTVSWKNGSDVGTLAGRPVRLRFALRNADLYSMRL